MKMDLLEKEWFIQAPWGRICILAWGNCLDPPVLLCHGAVDSAVTFRPLLKMLPKGFYYIGMELPGNGRSDPFPPGMMISQYDMVYAIEAVVKHFRWKTFAFVGHSLGALLGKVYNVSYPGKISKLIELDPVNFIGVEANQFSTWYQYFFTSFYENYDKYNMPREKRPKIAWQEAVESLMKRRSMSEENAIATLHRWSEPTGDGLIRYTFDQRTRQVCHPPFSPEHIRKIYTNIKTPTLAIVTAESKNNGLFRNTPFLIDESCYPNGNFRMRLVNGEHDVHVNHPERIVSFLGQFLLYGLDGLNEKAKL